MINNPWDKNIIFLTEQYEEVYPSGKRNYEMVHIGPLAESRFLYIPEDCKDANALIQETHERMHDRLVAVVKSAVKKAIADGRLIMAPAGKPSTGHGGGYG